MDSTGNMPSKRGCVELLAYFSLDLQAFIVLVEHPNVVKFAGFQENLHYFDGVRDVANFQGRLGQASFAIIRT